MTDVIRSLKATVTDENENHLVLSRGDELPGNIAPAEVDRLKEMGALGDPFVLGRAQEFGAPEQDAASLQIEPGETPGEAENFVDQADVQRILAEATNPEVSQRLLDAEYVTRGADARLEVIQGLEARGAVPAAPAE